MKTILFTGTEEQMKNLSSLLEMCDNDLPAQAGLTCLLETHYIVVETIETALRQCWDSEYEPLVPVPFPGLHQMYEDRGFGGKWELAEDITREFESIHVDNDWSVDDWMETLEAFVHNKINSL